MSGGCDHEETPFDVSGQVPLEGVPVAKGVISFVSVTSSNGQGSVALIENGRFELTSRSRLPAGEYIVRITDAKPDLEEFETKRFSGSESLTPPATLTQSSPK